MINKDSWFLTLTIKSWYILIPLFIVYLATITSKIKKRGESYSKFQYITLITLGIYILSVIALTLFPIDVNWGMYRNLTPWYARINPIPIITIDLTTFILNIIMLVPYGVYQWLLVKEDKICWEHVATKSFIFSIGIELSQILLYIIFNSARSVDINDVLANTLGGIIGYYMIKCVLRNEYFRKLIDQFKLPQKRIIDTV